MSKCIIHIGMHKTGSSSIQQSLHNFTDSHFQYATLGMGANHSLAMYSLFSDNPGNHHLHQAARSGGQGVKGYVFEVGRQLEQSIEAAGERTLIISGEDICALSVKEVEKLYQRLSKHFTELQIAGYVRPPAGFISSAFQQKVKGGSCNRLNLKREYRNYRKNFSKFDEIFGRDKVQLWKFAPNTFLNGCVVQDFCSRLNIDLPTARICRINESLPRNIVSCLYTYNKFSEKLGFPRMTGPEGQLIGRALADVGDTRFRFSPDIIKPILEENREDIEWMEQRLGEALEEELGNHQALDIRGEDDLLQHDRKLTEKIRSLLAEAEPSPQGDTAEKRAGLIHALREQIADGRKRVSAEKTADHERSERRTGERISTGKGPERIEISDLVKLIGRSKPGLLETFGKGQAEEILRELFLLLNRKLAEEEKELIQFVGLGRFRWKSRSDPGRKQNRGQFFYRQAKKIA